MVVPNLRLLGFLIALVTALWWLSRRYDPQKPTGRAVEQLLTGFLLLTVWNAVASSEVGINPLSAWLSGALGLPGLGLTVLLNLL